MFWDKTALYPYGHCKLGRYLSPSIDIGPTLMGKNIKESHHVLHRSTYWALTQEQWEWEEWKAECSSFIMSLHWRQIYICWNIPHFGQKPEVITKWGDKHANANLLVLKGVRMVRGQVVHWKQNANGNPIDRSNQNPIWNCASMMWNFPGQKLQSWQPLSSQNDVCSMWC